ncbi:MAG: DNA-packaging protein [Hoeflea sp.]|nr:DNA-packaging protein [Hoeflea sp.]|tara:strand:+ start:503 stop:814 length:312 start_codon:yes stop_codon:yes gene_type:complete
MATLVTIDEAKAHLNILEDDDDALISGQLKAAESHVERLLGYRFASVEWDAETLPDDIRQAVLQLAAHWYENREASVVGVSANAIPFGVREILAEWREYSFGG